MASITEVDEPVDLRTFVERTTLIAEGVEPSVLAALIKSPNVKCVYVGFRLFLVKEDARAWLEINDSHKPMPKSLERRKRVLKESLAGTVDWDVAHRTRRPYQPEPVALLESIEPRQEKTLSKAPSPAKPSTTQKTSTKNQIAEESKAVTKRPSATKLRDYNARLRKCVSKDERAVVYKEAGVHPVALAHWFRMLGLPKAAATPAPAKLDVPMKSQMVAAKKNPPAAKRGTVTKKPKPHRKARPTDAKLRKLHTRLHETATAEERRAIYDECGHHPVALGRWFRMLNLESIGASVAREPEKQITAKRGPGRPKGSTNQPTRNQPGKQPAEDKTDNAKGRLKLISGLSVKTRETAIELLAALLSG